MARLGPQKRRDLERALGRNGLQEYPERGKGSHTWWEHPDNPRRCTTVPGGVEVKRAHRTRSSRMQGRPSKAISPQYDRTC